MASTDATAVPVKNQAYRVTFPIFDADGDLVTAAAGLDSEVSKDAGTFADATSEATEIATSSGMYYLDLTATEMNADTVAIIVKTSTSGAKTTPIVLYPQEAGDINVDVTYWNGTAVSTPGTAGIPEVNLKNIANAAVSTSTAQLGVNVVNAGGTAWASGALTSGVFASGAITAAAIAADAIGASELAADAVTEIRSLASGTSDSGSTTTMVDSARTEADDDYWKGQLIVFTSGNISGQARVITGFTASTDTITFAPATTQAVSTQTYEIWPIGDFLRPTTSGRTLDVSTGGEAGLDWANIGSPTTAQNLSATNIDVDQIVASVSGAVGSVTGAVGSVASGGITAASLAADAITAAKIADGAIDAATFAAGAINAAAIASDAITDAKVASDVTIASVTGAVGSVTGNVGGNVTGSVGSLATQAKADVNAEVVDALATDTYAEPGQGAPAATASLSAKINYLYKAWRNKKTQTATTFSLFADDASTVDQKATVSDDGTTFTSGEVATGP